MTRVASSTEGDKKTTKGGKIAHTERERITEKGRKKRFQKGEKAGGEEGARGSQQKQTYTERCLCSDFWKRSEVIWHTAWSSPAFFCTVAARKQTQTYIAIVFDLILCVNVPNA